jgi:hypothetical protein
MRFRWDLTAATALTLLAPSAGADEPRTSSLSWIRMAGAEECVPTQELARAVEGRLGRAVFVSAAQADVSVEGHVEPVAGGFRAFLSVRDPRGTLLGTRDLSALGSCDALREQIVLVIALMIDPDAARPAAPPVPAPVPASTQPAPASLPISTPTSTPTPETRIILVHDPDRPPPAPPRPWRTDAGVSAAFNVGQLPKADLGIAAQGEIVPPGFWGIEVYGAVWFLPATRAIENGASEFTLAYAGLALCPLLHRTGSLHYSACAGGELGNLHARSSGFDHSYTQDGVVMDAALRGRLGVAMAGPFEARVGTSVAFPLIRDHFVVTAPEGDHEVFRVLPVAVVVDAGLGVRFP